MNTTRARKSRNRTLCHTPIDSTFVSIDEPTPYVFPFSLPIDMDYISTESELAPAIDSHFLSIDSTETEISDTNTAPTLSPHSLPVTLKRPRTTPSKIFVALNCLPSLKQTAIADNTGETKRSTPTGTSPPSTLTALELMTSSNNGGSVALRRAP